MTGCKNSQRAEQRVKRVNACCAIQEACGSFLFFPKIVRGIFPWVPAVFVRGAGEMVQSPTTPGTHNAASVSFLQHVTASWPRRDHVGTKVGGDKEGGGEMTALPSSLLLMCYISHLRGGDMSPGQTRVQLGGDV